MLAEAKTMSHGTWCWLVQTDRLPRSGKRATPSTNGWGRLTIRCFSVSQMSTGRFLDPFQGWGRRLVDVFTGVSTSSRRHLWRHHVGSKMAAPEMMSSRTWGTFFEPYWGGGRKWRSFRFRSPSWMTSFANEVIQDGDWKRKGRHLPPSPQ